MLMLPKNLKVTKELVTNYGQIALAEHGYGHIPVTWTDKTKAALGRAVFMVTWQKVRGRKRRVAVSAEPLEIRMSTYAFERMPDKRKAIDTVLHEAAHIIAGFKAGHGPEWKKWCLILGANPQRLADDDAAIVDESEFKWSRGCPDCDRWNHFHRKPKLVAVRTRGRLRYQYRRLCALCKEPVKRRQNF